MVRRRVVTGLVAEGRSIIVSDGPSPGRNEVAGRVWEELWGFDRLPAALDQPADPVAVDTFRLTPGPHHIACRVFALRPEGAAPLSAEQDAAWYGRFDYAETEIPPEDDRWMHRTPTVDIIVIVSGELELELDGGEVVRLKAGDSVIQRGTMHTWRTVSREPALAVAFMVRAED
jgi:mannose-6-phosphate isomerase-like protein (cupin superfamily)